MEGQLLGGRYELMEHLGSGGTGTAWAAHDRQLDRTVALTVVAEAELSPEDAERLAAEAGAAAALTDHPHLAAVHEFGRDGSELFVVTDRVTGRALDELLAAEGAPGAARAVDWARQICAGLAAAHEAGVVHHHLTPADLVLTEDGTVKILGLGIARLRPARGPEPAGGADTGLGRVPWMSPEQVRGDQEADHRSDLYAVGCILYQLLTGATPFGHREVTVQFGAHLREAPAAPSLRRAGIPAGLDELVLHLLAKAPQERPESAAEVAALLGTVAAGTTTVATAGTTAAATAAHTPAPRIAGFPATAAAAAQPVPVPVPVPTPIATPAAVTMDTPFGNFEPEPWWRRPSGRRAGLAAAGSALALALISGLVWAVGSQGAGADGGRPTRTVDAGGKAIGPDGAGAIPFGSASEQAAASAAAESSTAPAESPTAPGASASAPPAAGSTGTPGPAATTRAGTTPAPGTTPGATAPAPGGTTAAPVPNPPASPATGAAAYGCSGGLIDSYPVKTSTGVVFGYYYLYFDGSTGNNCAATIKTANSGYGTASAVKASISRCSNTAPSNSCSPVAGTTANDEGSFAKYAGPVKVNAAAKCITGFGSITWNGVTATTSGSLGNRAVHCG
ncbi:protein kinase [Kitasatospora sp. NBC_00374]|uniref:protein kinase domain-containing protein n=1 Tax=Kitasatospora sp. NBC_00374 TaxID=2975964 RepID=UPI00324DE64F